MRFVPEKRKNNRFIVLVDDDANLSGLYERGLRWAGFDVAAFSDASAFLAGLETRIPDVVVLDWMMPGMKGGQLLELLPQDSRAEKLPVFILSSLPESGGAEAKIAVEAGAMGWLEKATTTPAALTQKVEEALGSQPFTRRRARFPPWEFRPMSAPPAPTGSTLPLGASRAAVRVRVGIKTALSDGF